VSLSVDALLLETERQSGLSDWGQDQSFREGLMQLTSAVPTAPRPRSKEMTMGDASNVTGDLDPAMEAFLTASPEPDTREASNMWFWDDDGRIGGPCIALEPWGRNWRNRLVRLKPGVPGWARAGSRDAGAGSSGPRGPLRRGTLGEDRSDGGAGEQVHNTAVAGLDHLWDQQLASL